MQAIQTKYLPATAHRPPRIKASAFSGSITVNYSDLFDDEHQHKVTALALAIKMRWGWNEIIGGTLPNGDKVWILQT